MALREPDTIVGPYRERDSVFLTCTIRDNLDVAIPGSSLVSIVYTLYSERTLLVINSRDHVSCIGNVDGNGVLSLELTPADMAIVDNKLAENHRMLIEWIWNSTRRGSHEIQIQVSNVAKVP